MSATIAAEVDDLSEEIDVPARLLIVGDGNLSYAAAMRTLQLRRWEAMGAAAARREGDTSDTLRHKLGRNPPILIATTYDSEGELVSKYGRAALANAAALRASGSGAQLLHGIDAQRIASPSKDGAVGHYDAIRDAVIRASSAAGGAGGAAAADASTAAATDASAERGASGEPTPPLGATSHSDEGDGKASSGDGGLGRGEAVECLLDSVHFLNPLVGATQRPRAAGAPVVLANRLMLLRFLRQCARPGFTRQVCITTKTVSPYSRWRVHALAAPPLRLRRRAAFRAPPGFVPRNEARDDGFALTKAVTFVFEPDPGDDGGGGDAAAGAWRCEACDKAFTSAGDAARHREGRRHAQAMELEAQWLTMVAEEDAR